MKLRAAILSLAFLCSSAMASPKYESLPDLPVNPTGFFPQIVGIQRVPVLDFQGYASSPGNPSSGFGRFYYNSVTKLLTCLNSDGSSCNPASSGAPPTGAAGGDLSGTYPNPTVAQVNGAAVPTSAAVLGSNASKQLVSAALPTLTIGFIPKASTDTTLANMIVNSLCDEGITTASTFTCAEAAAFTSVASGATPPTCTAGSAGGSCYTEGTAPTAASGVDDIHADSTAKAWQVNNNNTGEMTLSRTLCVNVTPVTVAANVTSDQNLQACSISANALNVIGHTLKIWSAAVYSTPIASTATVNIKAKLCTVSGCGSGTVINLATITSSANPGTVTNNSINLNLFSATQTAGASAAFESHGNMTIDLGATPGLADVIFSDSSTGTIGTIDSTGALFLQISVAFSAGSTSNSVTGRQLIAELIN